MPASTDTIPVKLTPGEFVIKKEAVDMIGVPLLNKLNNVPDEGGGHRAIDELISMATMHNMKNMYGGGPVKMGGYQDGGQVMENPWNVPVMEFMGPEHRNSRIATRPERLYIEETGRIPDTRSGESPMPYYTIPGMEKQISELIKDPSIIEEVLGTKPWKRFFKSDSQQVDSIRNVMLDYLDRFENDNNPISRQDAIDYIESEVEARKKVDGLEALRVLDKLSKEGRLTKEELERGRKVRDREIGPLKDYLLWDRALGGRVVDDPYEYQSGGAIGYQDGGSVQDQLTNLLNFANQSKAKEDSLRQVYSQPMERFGDDGNLTMDAIFSKFNLPQETTVDTLYNRGGNLGLDFLSPEGEKLGSYTRSGGMTDKDTELMLKLSALGDERRAQKADLLGGFKKDYPDESKLFMSDLEMGRYSDAIDKVKSGYLDMDQSQRSRYDFDKAMSRAGFQEGGMVGYQNGGQVDLQKQTAGLWNRFRAEKDNPGISSQDLYKYTAMNTLGGSTPEMYDSMSSEGKLFLRDALLQRAALNASDEEAKFKLIQGMSNAGRKQYYANMPQVNETGNGYQDGGMVGPPAPQQNEIMQPGQVPPGTVMGPSDADIEQLRMMQAGQLRQSIQDSTVQKARDSLRLMSLLDSLKNHPDADIELLDNPDGGSGSPFLDDNTIYPRESGKAKFPSNGERINMLMRMGYI